MARQVVILVVVLIAIAGIVMADPPKASPGGSAAPVAESPDNIGPVDDPAGSEGGDDVVEGPVGGPTPLGEYGSAAGPTGASGAASVKKISAGVGGAAAALAGLFFY